MPDNVMRILFWTKVIRRSRTLCGEGEGG